MFSNRSRRDADLKILCIMLSSTLVDEIGYAEVEPIQVGLFFTLMHKRHRKKPTLITSNLGFTDWGSFLKNAHLTAALIDRLTENSHVINMKQCVSLRPKLSSESCEFQATPGRSFSSHPLKIYKEPHRR
jgi:DNA replication protein DnaC